ncbi:unnamed protein product [Ectocarpus sp. 12 AP-2014]
MVVVDAKAEWMRVERHQEQRRGSLHNSPPHPGSGRPTPSTTTRSVTYDLGKHAAGRRREARGVGGSRELGERMPRDVKDRMKALPRFIAILKDDGPPPARDGRPKDGASAEGTGEVSRRPCRREAGP